MANIRGLYDDIPPQNNNNNNNNNRGTQQNWNMQEVPFVMSYVNRYDKDPRDETFADFIRSIWCPQFKLKSFVAVISAIQIMMFMISLLSSDKIQGEFLQPQTSVLVDLGAKYPYLISQGYLWLLVTPILLHANFMHIFSNILSQLIFGTEMENRLGPKKFIIVYFLSGIGGNLFSSMMSDNISVGASSAIFGIIGSLLSYLILNWGTLARFGVMRYLLLFVIFLVVILNIVVQVDSKSMVDTHGHLGGFIVGILISLWLIQPIERLTTVGQYFQFVASQLVVLFFLIISLVYFIERKPKQIIY